MHHERNPCGSTKGGRVDSKVNLFLSLRMFDVTLNKNKKRPKQAVGP